MVFHGFRVFDGQAFQAGRWNVRPKMILGRNKDGEWEQATVHLLDGESLDDRKGLLFRFLSEVKPVDQHLIVG